jgi:hypothetical protein
MTVAPTRASLITLVSVYSLVMSALVITMRIVCARAAWGTPSLTL